MSVSDLDRRLDLSLVIKDAGIELMKNEDVVRLTHARGKITGMQKLDEPLLGSTKWTGGADRVQN